MGRRVRAAARRATGARAPINGRGLPVVRGSVEQGPVRGRVHEADAPAALRRPVSRHVRRHHGLRRPRADVGGQCDLHHSAPPPLVAADGFESSHRRDTGRRADPVRRRRADDQPAPAASTFPRGIARDGFDGHAVRAARPDRGGQHGRALRLPDRQSRRHIQRLLRGRERAADRSERRSCPRTSGARRRPRPSIRQRSRSARSRRRRSACPPQHMSRSCSRGPLRNRPPAAARRRGPCPA